MIGVSELRVTNHYRDATNLKKILILGGLFEESNSIEEVAFKYAVDHINRNRSVKCMPECTYKCTRMSKVKKRFK